jgi:hypothetical protein
MVPSSTSRTTLIFLGFEERETVHVDGKNRSRENRVVLDAMQDGCDQLEGKDEEGAVGWERWSWCGWSCVYSRELAHESMDRGQCLPPLLEASFSSKFQLLCHNNARRLMESQAGNRSIASSQAPELNERK